MAYSSENYAGPGRRKRPPVVGENARDKARIPIQSAARDVVDEIVQGVPARKPAAQLAALDLSPAEKKDVQSYSRVRSKQVQDAAFHDLQSETGRFLDNAAGLAVGVKPSEAFWSYTHPKENLLGQGRAANQTSGPALGFFPGLGGIGRGLAGRSAKAAEEAARPAGAEKIVKALPEARRVRAEQEKLRKAQRTERVGNAQAAREAAGGGEAGLRASRAEMRGEYARLPLGRLAKEFGAADSELRKSLQPQVDEYLNQIAEHPSQAGLEFRIGNTQDALLKMLDGQSVTKSEIRELENVFGEDATQHFRWRKARERVNSSFNLPRAMQATGDLSRAMRQDLLLLTRHPTIWAKNWKTMIRAAKNPATARSMMDDLRLDPDWDEWRDVGLRLSDPQGSQRLMEEDFIGADYAERIPVFGRVVSASNRAYNLGGAYGRTRLYSLIKSQNPNMSKEEKRHLARFINAATGQGKLYPESAEKAAQFLTMGLFSPRFIASRVSFLNPQWYFSLKGPARRQALESFASMVAAGTAVLWLADQLPGVEVGTDSRSADFGKIRFGDTRVDIWGGFQQYVVAGSRYYHGEVVSGSGETHSKSREAILGDFAKGKLAPVPGLFRDFNRGRTSDYQPVDAPLAGVPYGAAVGKLFVPINAQSAWDAKQDPKVAGLSLGLGSLGLGVLNYTDDTTSDPASRASSKRSSGGRYRSTRGGRYGGGPGRNYAGPRP